MKYHIDKSLGIWGIVLFIVFILLGLIGLLFILLLIDKLFPNNFTLGVVIALGLFFALAFLYVHIREKLESKKANSVQNQNILNNYDSVVSELEEKVEPLFAIVAAAEMFPASKDTGLNAYLRGMKVQESQYNRDLLISFSHALQNVIKKKSKVSKEQYEKELIEVFSNGLKKFI